MSLRNIGIMLMVIMVAVAGSACLWSSPSAGALVSRATNNALEADTVHFELSVELEGDIDPEELEFVNARARGAIDQTSGRNHFVLESAEVEFEVRNLEEATYVNMGDGAWLRMEADEFTELAEVFVPLFDPYAILDALGLDATDVKHEGSDEIRGEDAERFRIDVPARDIDQDVDDFLELTDDTTIRFWIGEGDLPVRIVIESRGEGDDFDVEANGEVTMRLTIDLFDYGKPVDVEAPPEEDIVDPEDFDFDGDFADPFEGAECYGDRVDECLQVNPQTEAMAQDPGACLGLDVRVCLVPVGNVRPDIVQAIVDFHKQTANLDVVVLPGVAIPASLVDRTTSQVTSVEAFKLVAAAYGVSNQTPSTFIAILPIDTRSDDFGWVFGQRYGTTAFGHISGAFSYFRMLHVPPYNGEPITEALVHERVAKYAARYTALLHLKYPMTEDADYLNYYEMYGFSELDSMGTKWPEGDPPCLGNREVVCVLADGEYTNPEFAEDVALAVERIARETNLPVEFRDAGAPGTIYYIPTKPDWGAEFASDLDLVLRKPYHYSQFPLIGVTDDNLAQDASIAPSIDRPFHDLQLSIVSGHGAGKAGTPEHQERLYRLILRGVLVANFGMELNDDPTSLLYRGITTPAELDGKTIPASPE